MKVHSALGPGFLEKVYENALMVALRREEINAIQQAPITVFFEQEAVGEYFADILIEDKIILELKTVEKILPIHRAQLLNYLKATRLELGIILNFSGKSLEHERLVL